MSDYFYKMIEIHNNMLCDDITAIQAAQIIKHYCEAHGSCDNCVFYDKINGYCTFTKHNRYGFHITQEDWEV